MSLKRKRQSWYEEQQEVVHRVSQISMGDKWRLGFYQIIWDKNQPQTRLKDNGFTEFLVSESYLSLKTYFDNLRNYGICATFAALGAWIWINHGTALPPQAPIWLGQSIAISVWLLVAVLLGLNCVQTWVITRELYRSIRALRVAKFYVYRGGGTSQFILGAIHALSTIMVDIFIGLFAFLLSGTVIAISLGFVAYAVLGRSAP